uniref:USP domain-containing protein n=1 Tax=Globisporangium ultimum (strain ATCC 200006 / CBS 805.95 / DAOM BR144) TaxID=431595 RepID=K3WJV6_GLOUD
MTQVKCERDVLLQEALDDGNVKHTSLLNTLQLKKEIGNARLVSGDAMVWVGQAKLTQKDVDVGATRAKEFRLEKGKRSFTFTLEMSAESKQFIDDLKEQIDGKMGLDVKKKKRKIRKQLNQATGFTPVNTLKSPMKKPPSTPTKLPTSATKPPRLTKPLEFSVAPVLETYQSYPSPSPSRSPFRSPFRKKPVPRQSNLPLSPTLTDPKLAASPRVREWLSPVRSLKTKAEFTPPDVKRQIEGTPNSTTSSKAGTPGSAEGRHTNKRVRSLQLLLEASPKDTQHQSTPPKPTPTITSPYFTNVMTKKQPLGNLAAENDQAKQSTNVNNSNRDDNMSESTDHENTQDFEDKEQSANQSFPKKNIRGLQNLGNYCYMNSIIQAMTALPDFMAGVQDEDWLYRVIRKKMSDGGNVKTIDQVKAAFESWKTSDESKPLALHLALEEILLQIVAGQDAPINPEPIKYVMGKKNAIFAT